MDPMTFSNLVALAVILPLLVLGVNIGVTLALAGMLGSVAFLGNWSAAIGLPLIQSMDVGTAYTLMVIPLFIAMGTIAGQSGITAELFTAFYRWFGRLPGGVAISTIGSSAGLSAITGSSMAVSAAMAKIAMPELRRFNYSDRLSFGSVAMGGTLAIMIPPSITMVLYATFAEQSIGKMLLAGLLPGLLLTGLYMLMILVRCIRTPELGPRGPKFSWNERFSSLLKVLPFLSVVILVILGILFGIFTPTESAAVGLVLVFLMAVVRRQITLHKFYLAAVDAVSISAAIFLIVIGSLIFSNFIALNGLGSTISTSITDLNLTPAMLFLMLIGIYLLLGMFLEATSILALTVPLVLPLVIEVGWSPIWFGVILILMMEIASVTPPVGLNLFVVKASIPGSGLGEICAGLAPFWIVSLLCAAILYFVPSLATYLPDMMIK